MLPYSLRLALRHFSRKKIYSSIIVLSLTVGFACTCLLVSFLVSESSADSFYTKKERLFELTSNDPFGGYGGRLGSGRLTYTVPRLGDFMINTFPEIENECMIKSIDKTELDVDNNLSTLKAISVDTSFFSMFDFPLLAGSKNGLTSDGIMIRVEKAKQLFGTTDVLGKLVSVKTSDTTRLLSITGVIDKPKEISHISFDAVLKHGVVDNLTPDKAFGGVLYLLLHDEAQATELMTKVNADSLRPTLMGEGKLDYFIDPIETAYTSLWNRQPFMQNRSETFLNVSWIVCGLILFMASFNFVNLFLLSMQERRKETGIQKTLGISVWQTIRASAVEASVYLGVSIGLSLILAYALVPIFNSALETNIEFGYLSRLKVLGIVVAAVVALMILIIFMTTIRQQKTLPVSMMRNVSAKVRFSKLFFTLQFLVSITLCVCTITIVKQMKFLEEEPMGFNKNIIQVNTPAKQSKSRADDLKDKVSQIAGVGNVALSQGNPVSGIMILFLKTEDDRPFNPYFFSGDEDMMKTLDLKLLEGKFDINNPKNVVVNETLVKYLDFKDPIGKQVPGQDWVISGVVKDFNCSSFKQEIPPVVINYDAEASNLLIDYSQTDLNVLLPKIRSAWAEIFPDDYFDYKIIQQDLMKKYSEESLFFKVVLAASITSMIISCFGLFALSWAVIRSRAKEMGIRKVLGATVVDILSLLTVSFAKRLLLAFVLAAPMGYYLMDLWMSRFAYKAPIDSWIFVITGVCLATIAIVTLGIQTLKASLSSPLDEIRE